MAKEKEPRKPFNLKKELKLAPGYIILLIWVIFTIVLLGCILKTMPKPGMAPVWQYSSGTHFYTLLFPVRC